MTVSLTPADLGKIEIEVSTKGKRVEISMISENHATKAMLESGLGQLKEALASQDLQLSKSDVRLSTSLNQEWNQFNQSTQFSDQRQNNSSGHRGFQRSAPESPAGLIPALTPQRLGHRISDSRVDLKI